MLNSVRAGVLEIYYQDFGIPDAWPVVLLHGFPYDVHAYAEVTQRLVNEGARVIIPYLRGYGPTRFLLPGSRRSGQQAALGADLKALLDALALRPAILAGYDWGGRAACVVAALWPERVRGLVSVSSYNIQDIAQAMQPVEPEDEGRLWYQYYFHSERGRNGLEQRRRALCRLLWKQWSPEWTFDDATFDRTAASFDNPDFVEVVIHSYRHRFGLVGGDPQYDDLESALSRKPAIVVPAVTIDGGADGVVPPKGTAHHAVHFADHRDHRIFAGVGHNVPQEAPDLFAQAVLDLKRA